MNPLPYFCLVLCCALPLRGKDLAAYRVGDAVEADVVTPAALDVPDPGATAALQAEKAEQFPAVFRSVQGATNTLAQQFEAEFAEARFNFLTELTNEFHDTKVDENVAASAEFGRFVTAFGVKSREFPASQELAMEWAEGRDGAGVAAKVLGALIQAESGRICSNGLPKNFVVGETVRLVPVTEPDQKLTFEAVQQGELAPAKSVMTLAEAQTALRRKFPKDEAIFARAMADFLTPNCLPDAPFTQLTRGAATYQMVVAIHFDAGDTVARKGDKVDEKTRAALLALAGKLKSVAPAPATPQPALAPASAPTAATNTLVATTSNAAAKISEPAGTPGVKPPVAAPAPKPASAANPAAPAAKPRMRHEGWIMMLAGISAGALLVALRQWRRERKLRSEPEPAAQAPLPFPDGKKDVTPQVAKVVREAVQQELAQQRGDLLVAQQDATKEIAALVHRLDELQLPMQERWQAYESRIQMLEKQLAERNEENRELLKLKLDATRQQLETERSAKPAPSPAAP